MSDAGDAGSSNAGDGAEESAGQAMDQGNAEYQSQAASSQDFSNAGQGPEQSAAQAQDEGNAQYKAEAASSQDFSNAGQGPEQSAAQAEEEGAAQYKAEAAPSQDFSNAGQAPEQSAAQAEEAGNAQYAAEAAPSQDFSNAAFSPQSVFTGPLIPTPIQAGLRYNTEVGISVFFKVMIDTIDLGAWAKCSGLGMNLAYDSRQEAGMTFFQHHLPKHLEYSKITLERPLTSDCQAVMSWITAYHMLPVPTSAQITCVDQKGDTITTWEMIGVSPESWRGPTFDAAAGSAVLATEQLTFFHQGFL